MVQLFLVSSLLIFQKNREMFCYNILDPKWSLIIPRKNDKKGVTARFMMRIEMQRGYNNNDNNKINHNHNNNNDNDNHNKINDKKRVLSLSWDDTHLVLQHMQQVKNTWRLDDHRKSRFLS